MQHIEIKPSCCEAIGKMKNSRMGHITDDLICAYTQHFIKIDIRMLVERLRSTFSYILWQPRYPTLLGSLDHIFWSALIWLACAGCLWVPLSSLMSFCWKCYEPHVKPVNVCLGARRFQVCGTC